MFSQWPPCGREFYPPCGRPPAGPGPPPPPAYRPSTPGHTCSGALRHRPAGSPLRGTRARGRSAPGLRVLRSATAVLGRSPPLAGEPAAAPPLPALGAAPLRPLRPQAPLPPARVSPYAPPPPAAGSAAPCAREPLRSGSSGRRLRTAWSGFRPPAGRPPSADL